jgi:hypothetical protein
MLNVQVTGENVNIIFTRNLISTEDLNEFLDKLRLKYLVSKSQMTEADAQRLAKELKSNWWKKNRERFLSKIK